MLFVRIEGFPTADRCVLFIGGPLSMSAYLVVTPNPERYSSGMPVVVSPRLAPRRLRRILDELKETEFYIPDALSRWYFGRLIEDGKPRRITDGGRRRLYSIIECEQPSLRKDYVQFLKLMRTRFRFFMNNVARTDRYFDLLGKGFVEHLPYDDDDYDCACEEEEYLEDTDIENDEVPLTAEKSIVKIET